jgi:hypothetical protein
MHGAGIISMGFLMDAIADTHGDGDDVPDTAEFEVGLKAIKDYCHWTEGSWDFGDDVVRRWNHVQNTPREIQRVTDFLLGHYRASLARSSHHRGAVGRQGTSKS